VYSIVSQELGSVAGQLCYGLVYRVLDLGWS